MTPSSIIRFFLILASLTDSGWAQGRAADYERAATLRERLSGKVFRDRVEPQWIGESNAFWYHVRTGPETHAYVVVDPGVPEQRPLFDHAELAATLGATIGKSLTADQLPFRRLDVADDLSTITFHLVEGSFQYTLPKGPLTQVPPPEGAAANGTTVKILPVPREARRRGPSTEIAFHNQTEDTLRLYWLGDVDAPTPYGRIEPGKRLEQHTYGGHVWMVKDVSASIVGVFEATDRPGLAVIDGSWKPGKPEPRENRQGRRRDRNGRDRRAPQADSPDKQWRAEIIDDNVRLTHRPTGEKIALTTTGTESHPFTGPLLWSPDSQKLLAIQTERAEKRVVHFVESSPKDQLQPILRDMEYVKPGDPLDHPRPRLFDISARKAIPIEETLFPNPWRLSDNRWDADSARFTFLYNQRGHEVLRLVAVDAETGHAITLVDETPETFVCYSSKAFHRDLEDTNEILWMSERSGWNHLYLFHREWGGLKHVVTQGDWVVRKVAHVDTEARELTLEVGGIYPDQDPYHVHHMRVGFDGKGIVMLTEADGSHELNYSPSREVYIDTYSRVDAPPVTALHRTRDGALLLTLETADISHLKETGWQAPERFVAKGRDGKTDIYGIIHKPTHFNPNKRYPVIERIYAGPHDAHVPKRFSARGSEMAELGFIVVQIDGMGTSQRSKAFHDVCWQNIGDAGFPDRVRWIRAAAETRPWMDITRVGIYGGSAGGQNAMRALIAHHDFYDVAVADCGCHDNRMDKIWWNEQWMGYPLGEHYIESSNMEQAHRLEGKLMLIVGELDRNVDPASTMQVVNALVKADKDFDLLVMPGVGHGAAAHPYAKRRQQDFFVRHLWQTEPRQP